MCRCSPVFVVGVLVLVIAAVACSVGFAAPFWMLYSDDPLSQVGQFLNQFSTKWSEGLWGYCNRDKSCSWYFENDLREEKSLPDWQKAAQGLYGFGLLLLLIGLLVGLIQMCCCFCCKESTSVVSTLGSLCISGASLITASLGVWGGYIMQERGSMSGLSFYWAFFVAIGGVATAVVSAILFFCEGCREKSYSGYHMTRVV